MEIQDSDIGILIALIEESEKNSAIEKNIKHIENQGKYPLIKIEEDITGNLRYRNLETGRFTSQSEAEEILSRQIYN